MLATTGEFSIGATLEEGHGDLTAMKDSINFYANNKLYYKIPYVNLDQVSFYHEGGKEHIDLYSEGIHHDCILDDNEDENIEFYHHIKKQVLDKEKVREFLRDRAQILKPLDKTMFDMETMAWVFDCKPNLYNDEFITAQLVSRLGESFSDHSNGVIYVTNRRLIFCSDKGTLKEMSLKDLKKVQVIYIDTEFKDSRGRRSYSIEFNDEDFNICVQTSKQLQIEAFYHHFDPDILTIDKY
jgi:hypothetical protein